MDVWIKLISRPREKREEGVGSTERSPTFVVFRLVCVSKFFSSLGCFVLVVGADARVDDDDIKQ